MDFVMVRAPNPPGSRASISPPGAVLEMAPAKVLQGAVRLHGLASSPTPDTQVRVAWAFISVAPNRKVARHASKLILRIAITPPRFIYSFPEMCPTFAGICGSPLGKDGPLICLGEDCVSLSQASHFL